MADAFDLILRIVGAFALAAIAFVAAALLILDIRHRRRGIPRPAPAPDRTPDNSNQRIYVGKWPK